MEIKYTPSQRRKSAILSFEYDTGSAYSLISESTRRFFRLPNPCPADPLRVKLATYSGQPLPVLGTLDVPVQYQNSTQTLPLMVVGGEGPSLCGRNWMEALGILPTQPYKVDMIKLPCYHPASEPVEMVLLMDALDSSPVTSDDIRKSLPGDPVLRQALNYTLQGWSEETPKEIELMPYWSRRCELGACEGLLFWGNRVIRGSILGFMENICIESSGAKMFFILKIYLEIFIPSFVCTSGQFWWPGLDKDIEETVRRCNCCQSHACMPPRATPVNWPPTNQPWDRVHIDHLGPFEQNLYLIVVDACTKWIEAIPVPNTSTRETIEQLRCLFARFGIPRTLVSDNGTGFTSEEFRQFMTRNGIRHLRTAPFHPSSNGLAERAVQTIKTGLKKVQQGSISQRLAEILLGYRRTPIASIGKSPSEMMFGRNIRSRLDLILPNPGKSEEPGFKGHYCTYIHTYTDRAATRRTSSVFFRLWREKNVALATNLVRAENRSKAEKKPVRHGTQAQPCAELSAKQDMPKKFSNSLGENHKDANSPTGVRNANLAAACGDVTTSLAAATSSNGAARVLGNWADCTENQGPGADDGFNVVMSRKRRRDSPGSPTTAAPSSGTRGAGAIRRPRSSTGWEPRAEEIRTTRAHIAEARARQASSTEDHCVYVERSPELEPYHYMRAINRMFGITREVFQMTKMNGHFLVGLANIGMAERLVNEGLEVEGTLHRAFPFRKRAERITVGNLPFFVGDAAVISALSSLGRVTSIAPKLKKAGHSSPAPQAPLADPGAGVPDIRRPREVPIMEHRHDRGFLESLLTSLRLPPAFMSWVNILYAGADATIRAGGFYTTAFPLLNGLKQLTLGVGNVIAYADDIVLLFHRDGDFERVATVLEEYKQASGIGVNFRKSAGLWCSAWRNHGDSPLGASWSTTSIRVLGLDIAPRNTVAHREQHLLALLETTCRRWTPFTRGHSLVGRARAANSLVGSTIQHHLHGYLPSPLTIAKLQARLASSAAGPPHHRWLPVPPPSRPPGLRFKSWPIRPARASLCGGDKRGPCFRALVFEERRSRTSSRPRPRASVPAKETPGFLSMNLTRPSLVDVLDEDVEDVDVSSALGAFCRRLTSENAVGFGAESTSSTLASAVVLCGTATPFLNGLTTRSARRALDRPRLAATPITRFTSRWSPTIGPPPSRIDWTSLRRCAFSGHKT
ncbi:K02A2.6-like [Cordylochernes scorpioides]|uniref:RNA-directed DNA polymerase n=1 Tax=Cordylochernes scorpioides TaxID=51811 RepID=A0ABY6K934_9ARAC|nr:K02A2.6-like [Cordylochernes scorpioides]